MRMNLLSVFDATFQFDWLSLVLIGLLIVIPMIQGLVKGMGHMFIRVFAGALILLAAFFLAKPLAAMLNGTPLGGWIHTPILDFLTSKSDFASQANPGKEIARMAIENNNYEAIRSMRVPAPFAPLVGNYVINLLPETASEITIGAYVADALTILVLSVASFIAVWLILTIVKMIIAHIIDKRREKNGLRPGSRFFGMLIGLLAGAINLVTVFYVLSLTTAIPFMQNFLNAVWHLDDPAVITIGKWVFENEFFKMISAYFL